MSVENKCIKKNITFFIVGTVVHVSKEKRNLKATLSKLLLLPICLADRTYPFFFLFFKVHPLKSFNIQ